MVDFVLNRHVFLNGVTGSAGGLSVSTPFPCDYRYSGNQNRSFFYTKAAADQLVIQGSPDFGASAASTWFTVTSINATTTGIVALSDAPYASLRVAVSGAGGACTVIGLV